MSDNQISSTGERTMKLFIDCEFNEFGGDLLSMAIVSENGDEFYEVLNLENDLGYGP